MSPEEQKTLKQKIETEIKHLQNDIATLEVATRPIPPDDAIGRLTRMDAINTKSMHEANLRSASLKLSKLKRALGQIDDPDFGICLECEESIPLGRLMLVPESTLCVQCQERLSG